MARLKRKRRLRLRRSYGQRQGGPSYTMRHERDMEYLRKHLDKLWEHVAVTNRRLQVLEAQVNLLSRLVTTLCIEKFGMKLRAFKRLIHRIEKEAIADSEVRDLQALYELESRKR